MDAVNYPADLGFPVNRLKDAAGGGRSDDVVRNALDLHFRAGEAGEFAGDVEFDAVGHGRKIDGVGNGDERGRESETEGVGIIRSIRAF